MKIYKNYCLNFSFPLQFFSKAEGPVLVIGNSKKVEVRIINFEGTLKGIPLK